MRAPAPVPASTRPNYFGPPEASARLGCPPAAPGQQGLGMQPLPAGNVLALVRAMDKPSKNKNTSFQHQRASPQFLQFCFLLCRSSHSRIGPESCAPRPLPQAAAAAAARPISQPPTGEDKGKAGAASSPRGPRTAGGDAAAAEGAGPAANPRRGGRGASEWEGNESALPATYSERAAAERMAGHAKDEEYRKASLPPPWSSPRLSAHSAGAPSLRFWALNDAGPAARSEGKRRRRCARSSQSEQTPSGPWTRSGSAQQSAKTRAAGCTRWRTWWWGGPRSWRIAK